MKTCFLSRGLLLPVALTAGFAMLVACDADPVRPGGTPPLTYQDLSQRAHVLNNLELAYNQRNITQYDRLLDTNFTFFLSPGDVNGGLPAQWGRAEELQYASDLLDRNYPGPSLRCTGVLVNILWEEGLTWSELTPTSAPDETWYTTTVYYGFKFEFEPNYTYIDSPGAKVRFTVRNAGTAEAPHWQLVEWYDLSEGGCLGALGARSSTQNGREACETASWGGVKALYR